MSYNNSKNYLTGNIKSDEWYTPVEIVNYIKTIVDKNKKIICPFDTEKSEFTKAFPNSIHNINNFLEGNYEYDICVTNPPFSYGDKVIRKVMSQKKECIIIFPATAIFSVTFFKMLQEYKFNYIIHSPDKRVYFIDEKGNQNRPNFHSIILQISKDLKQNSIVHFKLEDYKGE